MILLIGIISTFLCEIRSYPYPVDLPYQLPSGYGTGPGHEVNVEINTANRYLTAFSNIDHGVRAQINHPSYQISVEGDNSNQILTPLANLGDTVNTKIIQAVNSKTFQVVTPFPDSGRQSAILESSVRESIPIQADIKYANLQQFATNFYHPKPIVDTIQEHEKYGNDGGKGRAISTLVISAFEGLSNALNTAVDTPFQIAKAVGRKITDTLNPVGAKLVGLA